MKDKTFVTLSGIFFLLFFIGIGALTLNEPITRMIRARDVKPSPLKSFGVVFPQVGTAGDENSPKKPAKIKVSIYIRDVNGQILGNRTVKLSTDNDGVSITPSDTSTTNDIGQAEFYLTSTKVGVVKLAASDVVSNTSVSNIPTVEFIE